MTHARLAEPPPGTPADLDSPIARPPAPAPPRGRIVPTRPPRSLRREIVVGYSAILLAALTVFAGATYLILRQSLARTGTQSLRQTALAAEQLIVPSNIPRVAVAEERLPPAPGDVEALRRRTRLATGEEVTVYVARNGDVESRALKSFALIALLLIPITALSAAVAGYSVADRLLSPLRRLVSASREIGIAGLSRRVDVPENPTELKELSLSFNGMLGRLERAVEALTRFTADASHELRTPLTAIRGTAEVALARPRSADELRETLGEVLEETESMLHLVEDLLTLARGDQAVGLRMEETDLAPVLHDVRDIGDALAMGKAVEVRLETPESLPLTGAAGALRRLFLNLVSNAVKFTESGFVTVTAREVPAPPAAAAGNGEDSQLALALPPNEAERWIEVSVADTGSGIAGDALPRVFDRFYRADAAREKSGGTGLGLAIARMIAEQHGGTITAQSTPGSGSTFTVRLPGRGV